MCGFVCECKGRCSFQRSPIPPAGTRVAALRWVHWCHCTPCHWAKEHLAGIATFSLAPRPAVQAIKAITMPRIDESHLTSLNGLMEDRIQARVKSLHHKLKHFAVWTVASFYNNFHLKLAQYIFNEFSCKTFNSPQFISSGSDSAVGNDELDAVSIFII